jgi:hypothetical protein
MATQKSRRVAMIFCPLRETRVGVIKIKIEMKLNKIYKVDGDYNLPFVTQGEVMCCRILCRSDTFYEPLQ